MRGMIHKLDSSDRWLLALGTIGFLAFALLLPRSHPDAALTGLPSEENVLAGARRVLIENGYSDTMPKSQVVLRRNPTVFDSLQRQLGRPAFIETIRSGPDQGVPSYYWVVSFDTEKEPRVVAGQFSRSVNLTLDGRFLGLTAHDPPSRPDRRALEAALGSTTAGLPDSALNAILHFVPDAGAWNLSAPVRPPIPERMPGPPPPALLGPDEVIRMAQYHIGRSALAGMKFRPDSVTVIRARPGQEVARIRLLAVGTEKPLYAHVDVRPTGSLRLLQFSHSKQVESSVQGEEVNVGFSNTESTADEHAGLSFSLEDAAGIIIFIVYLTLILISLVVFFRRLSNRLVDINSAIKDAAAAAIFTAVLMGITVSTEIVVNSDSVLGGYAIALLVLIAAAIGGGFSLFFLSAAGDSLAREVWEGKLGAISLVRRGAVVNVPVGASLLRGVGIAGVLFGLLTAFLSVLTHVALHFEGNGAFISEAIARPFVASVGQFGYFSLFQGMLVLLTFGSLLKRRWPHPAVTIGAIALVFGLMQVSIAEVRPIEYGWILGGIIGLGIGLAFWRYDVFSCIIALFVTRVVWEVTSGLLVDGSPEWIDAMLAIGLVIAIVAVGLIGVLRGKTSSEVEPYVPAYMNEMAAQERIKRELELARQVQDTFLPRRMPEVEGLDLAAVCHAALEVGGDYYDLVKLGPGRMAVAIGDVSGKGIQAAFYMTMAKGIVQTLCTTFDSPAEVLRRMNTVFARNAPRGMFISMIYGIVDVPARKFTFARAGHNPVILKRSPSHDAECMLPAGMAIGLTRSGRFDLAIEEVTVDVEPGDVLVFYTDGFSEARDVSHGEYGDDRLARVISSIGQRTATEILTSVTDDVNQFMRDAGQHDDMTMVVVKVTETEQETALSTEDRAHSIS